MTIDITTAISDLSNNVKWILQEVTSLLWNLVFHNCDMMRSIYIIIEE